jgi:hypothetical protein
MTDFVLPGGERGSFRCVGTASDADIRSAEFDEWYYGPGRARRRAAALARRVERANAQEHWERDEPGPVERAVCEAIACADEMAAVMALL